MSDRWTEDQVNAYEGTWGGDELTVMDELKTERKRAEAAEAKLDDICVGHRTIWDTSEGCPYCRLAAIAGLAEAHVTNLRKTADSIEAWQDPHLGPFDGTIKEIRKAADELQAELDKAND
jgi:hypothetical protein